MTDTSDARKVIDYWSNRALKAEAKLAEVRASYRDFECLSCGHLYTEAMGNSPDNRSTPEDE